MAYNEKYASYQIKLTKEQQAQIDAAGTPEEKMRAYEDIAIRAAKAQLEKPGTVFTNAWSSSGVRTMANALPGDEDIFRRFPGVDPRGKYSEVDMKIAQRQETINATLQLRDESVGKMMQKLMKSEEFRQLTERLDAAAYNQRTLMRAAKLCPDGPASDDLYLRAQAINAGPEALNMDLAMQGMEYMLGLRQGALPKEVEDFYRDTLHFPITPEKVYTARIQEKPAEARVMYPDFTSQQLQLRFSKPGNWEKEFNEIPPLTEQEINEQIALYSRAATGRTLDAFYSSVEQMTVKNYHGSEPKIGYALDRADFLIVDGKTPREMLAEDYRKMPKEERAKYESFDHFYRKEGHERTAELVCGALLAGKRVEAFLPDPAGRVTGADKPMTLTQKGFEPSKLEPVSLNAWEKFWNKFGFYKQKAAQADEYAKFAEARKRVVAYNVSAQIDARGGAGTMRKNEFFSNWKKEHNTDKLPASTPRGYSVDRSLWTSLATMQMLLDGYSLEDVLDPRKLQSEKQLAGAKVIDLFYTKNEPEAEAVFFHDASIRYAEEMDKVAASAHLRYPEAYGSHSIVKVIEGLDVGVDLFQDLGSKLKDKYVEKYGKDEFEATRQRLGGYSDLAGAMSRMHSSRKMLMLGLPDEGTGTKGELVQYLTGVAYVQKFSDLVGGQPLVPVSQLATQKVQGDLVANIMVQMPGCSTVDALSQRYEQMPAVRDKLCDAVVTGSLVKDAVFTPGPKLKLELPGDLLPPLPKAPTKQGPTM